MNRQFECFWGEGYYGEDNKSILAYHNIDFFNEERGYQPRDTRDLKALDINDRINFSDETGRHWVRRIA